MLKHADHHYWDTRNNAEWKFLIMRFRKKCNLKPWWCHQMETYPTLLAPFAGYPPHNGQWLGVLMFSLICAWTNGCVNNRNTGDMRRNCAHYDVSVMVMASLSCSDEELRLVATVEITIRVPLRSHYRKGCLGIIQWRCVHERDFSN